MADGHTIRTVGELMSTPPVTAAASELLADASTRMKGHGIGSVVVVDGERPIGILTERDLVRFVASGGDSSVTKVSEWMTEDPETAANGGELPGWIGETNNPLDPPELHQLHEIVLNLPVSQISPPFDLGDSRYILQVIERKESPALTFDQAKSYIKDLLTDRKHDKLQRQLQDQLAKKINLVVYDSALQAYYDQTAAPAGVAQPSGGL